MKKTLLILSLFVSLGSFAAHIKGGFFSYEYLGPGTTDPSANRYRITLTVYMICNANSMQVSNPINFSIYSAGNNQFIQNVSVSISSQFDLGKAADEPCISGNQTGCYYKIVVYDLASIELPSSPNGYTIAYQRCCRITGIANLQASGDVGNTFAITIPGSAIGNNVQTNSSPIFLVNDTAVVCGGSFFQYSFQATDINSEDELSYSFCSALQGASMGTPAPVTATAPPYGSVPYQAPFNGAQPMGPGVTIDPQTGLISGVAPSIPGEYVICVCVNEIRNGVLIGRTRKELHIRVGDCVPIAATLEPQYITCDGFNFNFINGGDQSQITSYNWFFGDPASGPNDSSNIPTPTHVFSDTGVYNVTLIVNRGQQCTDTGVTIMKVYPGFFPGFTIAGSCFQNPFQFTDTTNTRYGVVDSWKWDFGDLSTIGDTSRIQNPQWTYPNPGPRTARLIVTNSKGCVDTATVDFTVLDKPALTLAFRDTLICITDAVTLNATGSGTFSWTPLTNITGANTSSPTVTPTTDTWYVVNINDNGCVNRDSVRVRVISVVSLTAMADTTICLTDNVQLSAVTNGLQFQWTPAATLDNPSVLNPVATPTATSTTYTIRSIVGSCSTIDDVVITTVPYPVANAGISPTICYNTSAQLNASINGSSFSWSPVSYLNDPAILNPISSPPRTTQYVLSAFDTLGCPKPGRDTVIVTVLPRVRAYAGPDTTVVVGQPLQFNATGGITYLWSPPTGLSATDINDPVGIYDTETDSVRYQLIVRDQAGCADSTTVLVKVFKTNPYVFVPTAFTPNNDGLNDVIRPFAVGIQRINYFTVYNRWGQRVFTTNMNMQGWDGRINGQLQASGVFVWVVSAVDYIGRPLLLKGTVTLIR